MRRTRSRVHGGEGGEVAHTGATGVFISRVQHDHTLHNRDMGRTAHKTPARRECSQVMVVALVSRFEGEESVLGIKLGHATVGPRVDYYT